MPVLEHPAPVVRTIATMPSRLPRLALLALLSPACWSGFAEVRVAGSDRPLADAARAPDGAQDATADTGGLDAPSLDVVDVGELEDRFVVDVVDTPAPEDARDAGVGLDAVDAPELRDVVATEDRVDGGAGDVVDVPAPVDAGPPRDCGVGFSDCNGACAFLYGAELHCGRCGNACATGNICIRGMCGAPTRFVGAVTFGAMEYARDANAVVRWDALCAGRYGSSARVCTSHELPREGEGARACAAIGDPDGGVRQAVLAMPPSRAVAREDGTFGFWTLLCRGTAAESQNVWDGPTVAACCAP